MRLKTAINKSYSPKTNIKFILKIWKQYKDNINIRINLACNQNTPLEILEDLCLDNNYRVRLNVATNPNISNTIREILIKDIYSIRHSIIMGKNTPAYILKVALNDDENKYLKKEIIKRIPTLANLLEN